MTGAPQRAPRAPRFRRYTAAQRRQMLIEAGLRCLGDGGITSFTIDRICAEAGASRGLVTHHFGSKDGLLAACYTEMYDQALTLALPERGTDLGSMVVALFDDALLGPSTLHAWLALWGEIGRNTELQAAHRLWYERFKSRVAATIRATNRQAEPSVSPEALAVMFISLVDGLWLERWIDPEKMQREDAMAICFDLLEAVLGPIQRPAAAPL